MKFVYVLLVFGVYYRCYIYMIVDYVYSVRSVYSATYCHICVSCILYCVHV